MAIFDVDGQRTFRDYLSAAFHSSLYLSGISNSFLRYKKPHAATILMYHSVEDPDTAGWVDPRWTLARADFERGLDFLARERRVIALEELIHDIQVGRPIPAGTVALTFDDGYRDNLKIAAPLLRRYKLPASFFIPTGYMNEGANMWVDQLYNAFRLRTRHQLQLALLGAETIALDSQAVARAVFHRLNDLLIYVPRLQREQLLEELIAQLKPTQLPPRLVLNWDELRRLRRDYPEITIGAHSRAHDALDHREQSVIAHEIDSSLADLQRETDVTAELFSFPYNRSSELARSHLADVGIKGAVGGGAPLIDHAADPYNLGRLDARMSSTQFKYKTSGAFPTLINALKGRG